MIKCQAGRAIVRKGCQTMVLERGSLCYAGTNRIRSAQAMQMGCYRTIVPQAISLSSSLFRESRHLHHWMKGGAEMSCTELITGSAGLNTRLRSTRLVSVV